MAKKCKDELNLTNKIEKKEKDGNNYSVIEKANVKRLPFLVFQY